MASVPFASLLMDTAWREPFLQGVYAHPLSQAAFKCAHTSEQLRDCDAASHALDAKVCDILRWEQALCWSRYVARAHFDAVRQCYASTPARDRGACDEHVMALRGAVEQARSSLTRDALRAPLPAEQRAALHECPAIVEALSEDAVNASMTCMAHRVDPQALAAVRTCLGKAGESGSLATCVQPALMRALGAMYGVAKGDAEVAAILKLRS